MNAKAQFWALPILVVLIGGAWLVKHQAEPVPDTMQETAEKPGVEHESERPAININRDGVPDFDAISDVNEMKKAFFDFFYPLVVAENKRVLKKRQIIKESRVNSTRLQQLCERYLDDCEQVPEDIRQQLLDQVDIVPPSLALAQAAKESGWGRSRFAIEGNNYFGQWCFTEGCGLIPSGRRGDMTHEVRVFKTPRLAVRSYIFNLNKSHAYEELRDIRAKHRAQGEPFDGHQLAATLLYYSERREAYVEELESLIEFNNLTEYDERFWQKPEVAGR